VRLDWKLVRGRWAFPTPKPLLSHVTSPPLCGSNSFSGARIKEAKTKLSTCTIFTTEIGVLYNNTNLLVSKTMAKEEQHNSTYLHLAVYEKSLYNAIRPKSDSFKL